MKTAKQEQVVDRLYSKTKGKREACNSYQAFVCLNGKGVENLLKKIAFSLLLALIALILLAGCNKDDRHIPNYTATGEIDALEKTGGIVDGVKSEYIIRLTNLQPESLPSPGDSEKGSFSITKNTLIYKYSNGVKTKADITAIEKGKRADIIWRFANDHLTEAVEINIQ